MNRFFVILSFFVASHLQAQQTDYVDFKTAKAQLSIVPEKQAVSGFIEYEFKILKPVDSVFIDAVNMKFQTVYLENKKISYSNDGKKLWVKHDFKPDSIYKLSFNYDAFPKKAMYFIDWDADGGNKQIWTQGQGKYTSNWLPSIDDMNDKMEFDLTITFNKDYEVISNGKLTNKQINDSTITWHYDMQQPMSSYLVALAIGKYHKRAETSKSGIPLELYYYPEDSLKFEPTYRYTKQIFDFLETEIGVPYPWQNYKQVPVKDFLYAGMENTGTTIFADSFVIDSIAFIDKNYVNVNAHELAHQWFGNLVTETSGIHHWLQEGFATYYALLAEKAVFGDDYYYWQLYQYAQELLEQDKAGESTSLLDPKSSSTTFYKKGALVLHLLREKVGDEAFKKGIKNYLLKHPFKNVGTNDFISEVEKTSGQNLKPFVDFWLVDKQFHYEAVLGSLEKSPFIQDYLKVDCETNAEKCAHYLSSNISDEAKIKVILQQPNLIKVKDFQNGIKVRQAITMHLAQIPSELKTAYESLLNDESYVTIEKALFHLWLNFPHERKKYLSQTKGIQGFNDKNIRTLWLALTLLTADFEPENKQMYFQELTNYTNPVYGFEIRQNAFLYLQEIKACNDACKENLNQATTHHSWQFSKFAKTMLEQLNSN
ncbi:M1 family metallopeptidase [Mariniflexile maritimum]|uniref:M1 family metallopeptidase n=1 Tax=Mariniflexile maritimum TaxID=2682493 RepID=UPI0012F6E709|nr:M1 family metallopeptidase [Mariniflexile maritimum]